MSFKTTKFKKTLTILNLCIAIYGLARSIWMESELFGIGFAWMMTETFRALLDNVRNPVEINKTENSDYKVNAPKTIRVVESDHE